VKLSLGLERPQSLQNRRSRVVDGPYPRPPTTPFAKARRSRCRIRAYTANVHLFQFNEIVWNLIHRQ